MDMIMRALPIQLSEKYNLGNTLKERTCKNLKGIGYEF